MTKDAYQLRAILPQMVAGFVLLYLQGLNNNKAAPFSKRLCGYHQNIIKLINRCRFRS